MGGEVGNGSRNRPSSRLRRLVYSRQGGGDRKMPNKEFVVKLGGHLGRFARKSFARSSRFTS
ncbi:hypothetical protein Poly24_39260 [Rosistilla carotiformis]|uniref:Uncharacterized protein n=1 Tax=Rosistilla carotiformis TaxID=2528017 RepID=A0A518JXD2_9BACT|nr:hypothetical protein Poly24_39260 [Rosistilla carotiformis]